MPGVIPHLIAGSLMFIIGSYYFKNYFDDNNKTQKLFLLLVVCLSFSLLPDFFLIIYYSTYILPIEVLLEYHNFVFLISGPIAIVGLVILKFGTNIKTKPIWIMGLWCILLHIIMDLLLPHKTVGIWI